jgi:OOP family OmpA-OmpF porin
MTNWFRICKQKVIPALLICLAMEGYSYGAGIDNWLAGVSKEPIRNGQNLCWRNASWTPATAAAGCDTAIVTDLPSKAKKKANTPPKHSRKKLAW